MKISMIGTGYVGLVSGTCFAEMGNNVVCIDIDKTKIENLKKGIIPIYEPGLEEMVRDNYAKKNLHFSTDIKEAVEQSDICFIAVGTPQGEDGSADLQYVTAVASDIGKYMIKPLIVVDKSTVPVGTADKVRKIIADQLAARGLNIHFDIVSNPEFLKEGAAIKDFMQPDRVVIGADNQETVEKMHELYKPFMFDNDRFITMDIRSAEMTKYVANSMLATKISFINEMSVICERVGADINKVRIGIGSDSRIGYSFINPGCGYGGSCFPKDVQALIKTASEHEYSSRILQAVEAVNKDQKYLLVEKVLKKFGNNLSGKVFAIWGLAFKPETDDMREASSLVIVKELTSKGAMIQAYDPKARHEAEKHYFKDNPNIKYYESKYDALKNADAMLLITEWKEFTTPDFDEIGKLLKNRIIFDGRNQYSAAKMKHLNFEYYQIGTTDI